MPATPTIGLCSPQTFFREHLRCNDITTTQGYRSQQPRRCPLVSFTGVARGDLRGLPPSRWGKISNSLSLDLFFKPKVHKKPFSAGALLRTRLGELTALTRPHSWLERGIPPSHSRPPRRLWRLELRAYGASVLRPPQHKILATPVVTLPSTVFRRRGNFSFRRFPLPMLGLGLWLG